MEVCHVLHERYAFSFGGLGDNNRRFYLSDSGFMESLQNLLNLMTVYLDDMPAE